MPATPPAGAALGASDGSHSLPDLRASCLEGRVQSKSQLAGSAKRVFSSVF